MKTGAAGAAILLLAMAGCAGSPAVRAYPRQGGDQRLLALGFATPTLAATPTARSAPASGDTVDLGIFARRRLAIGAACPEAAELTALLPDAPVIMEGCAPDGFPELEIDRPATFRFFAQPPVARLALLIDFDSAAACAEFLRSHGVAVTSRPDTFTLQTPAENLAAAVCDGARLFALAAPGSDEGVPEVNAERALVEELAEWRTTIATPARERTTTR